MGDAGVEARLYDRGCARGFGLGKRARKEVDERRHDDGQRHSGEMLVENAGSRALSTAEAEYYAVVTGAAEGLGMQPMMTDLGRGFVSGQTPTQPKRLLREEDLERHQTY